MACERCRLQARVLVRAAVRPGAARAAAARTARKPLPAPPTRCGTAAAAPVRWFSGSAERRLLGIRGSLAESYRVLGATERLYQACSQAADYRITEEERKQGRVRRLDDGEELGQALVADNVWHTTFQLHPSFSTWSHVTMLHLYLLNARVRCLDRDAYRSWQQQLTDHFFFECEKKMHLDHSITSSALRQRYLKDIFVQWRGLLLAYDEGLIKGDAVLASAVWRNLFKGAPDTDPRALLAIVGWIRWSLAALEATSDLSFPQQAPKILAKPVHVFWTSLEGPLGERQDEEGGRKREQEQDLEQVPERSGIS